jgi:superfamily II RNA helicase
MESSSGKESQGVEKPNNTKECGEANEVQEKTEAAKTKGSQDDEVIGQMQLKIEEFAEKHNALLLELSQKLEELFKQFLSSHETIWKRKSETMRTLTARIIEQTRQNAQLQQQLESLHSKIVHFYEMIGQFSKSETNEDY